MTHGEAAEGTGRTIYAVLGDPVAHSLSPLIHNEAFRAAGRNAVYVARRVDADECGEVARNLALAGGGGNVTLPHKELVVPFLDRQTPAVSATGACNTFWADDGEVWGDNTDVEGFKGTWRGAFADVESRVQDPVSILVLGAGGAARAVLFGLLGSVADSRILLWNRTAANARRLVRHFDDSRLRIVPDWRTAEPDVVVNATSAGLYGFGMPIDPGELARCPLALIDLVYTPEDTPLCRSAKDLSIRVTDGRDMLVRQALASQARWFGERPPIEVMRRALP
ncbi:MAG: shikimate dehydrogenase [Gemmatimonadetes bacterium]|nr:shikimate dehydrogenase [Gemmatimonadota bacterium]